MIIVFRTFTLTCEGDCDTVTRRLEQVLRLDSWISGSIEGDQFSLYRFATRNDYFFPAAHGAFVPVHDNSTEVDVVCIPQESLKGSLNLQCIVDIAAIIGVCVALIAGRPDIAVVLLVLVAGLILTICTEVLPFLSQCSWWHRELSRILVSAEQPIDCGD